jgi:hypothetical protein
LAVRFCQGAPQFCPGGGMVDTTDLKSVSVRSAGSSPASGTTKKGNAMPMYEATVRTPQGDTKDRVYAKDLKEAKQLLEQRHGPRNVPYVPKIIPS